LKIWRWIDSGFADGATHMAIDQAMLENAGSMEIPTMRVYRWRPFCISLGYNQSVECIDPDRCLNSGIDVVRRPTGGRAVLHAEEVTYSVVIPKQGLSFSSSIGHIYHLVSQGLVRGLRKCGVQAVLQKRSPDFNSHYKTSLSVSCFSAAARHEILLNGKKLVGSAQRQVHDGILQHGSILTGEAHLALPEYLKDIQTSQVDRMKKILEEKTISIAGYLRHSVDYGEIVRAIKGGMKEELSIEFEEGELTVVEKDRAEIYYPNFSVFSGKMVPLPEDAVNE